MYYLKFLEFIFYAGVFYGAIYCLFSVARAGWERDYDKIKNLYIENAKVELSNCTIKGKEDIK